MKSPMTTRQAWLEIAKAWDRAKPCLCGCGMAVAGFREPCTGICNCLANLYQRDRITEVQYHEMTAIVDRAVDGCGFLCECTLKGAKIRAKFCRKQAALLTPKRKRTAK